MVGPGHAFAPTRDSNSGTPSWAIRRHHVVVVMDALQDFSPEALQWALLHVVEYGCIITLLGVMPWLNIPLQCKTWLDVWTLKLEMDDLTQLKERIDWKCEKYQKIRGIVELCERHGAKPHMKVIMGHPRRLRVLEETMILQATWVVFDRHQQKRRVFYTKRLPCSMAMMKADGGVDMLKVKPLISSPRPSRSAASPSSGRPPSRLSVSWSRVRQKHLCLEEEEGDRGEDAGSSSSASSGKDVVEVGWCGENEKGKQAVF